MPDEKLDLTMEVDSLVHKSRLILNNIVTQWISEEAKIRVRVNGMEYSGTISGFDGARMLLLDDLETPTIIHLNSGVAVVGPPDKR